MPESRHRYLNERLGDHDFQQLVSALLAHQFPHYIPMALRQADGGRDRLRKDQASRALIYQVKWSLNGKEKDPVSWLDQVVRSERRVFGVWPHKVSAATSWSPTWVARRSLIRARSTGWATSSTGMRGTSATSR